MSSRRQKIVLPVFTSCISFNPISRPPFPTARNVHSAPPRINSNSMFSSTMPLTPCIIPPAKRSRRPKAVSTVLRVLQARLDVLNATISSYESRTDLRKKQNTKRLKHMEEKSVIEAELAALRTSDLCNMANQAPMSSSSTISCHHAEGSATSAGTRSFASESYEGSSGNPVSVSSQAHSRPIGPLSTVTNLAVEPTQSPLAPTPAATTRRTKARDQIVPPSTASGGIPEPSQLYLSYCNMAPKLTAQPQHLLLVLDLNGTLLFRPNRNRPRHFVERPSTQQFLNYAIANFSVMIWSSAQPQNVQYMCEELFPAGSRQRLLGIWGRDRLGLSKEDSKKRVQVYKRLDRIWNDPQIQSQHPLANQGERWHQGNTVLLDDSQEKSRSEPYNFVEIIEFTGALEHPNILRDVAGYLETLRMQANVSSYILQYPLRIIRGPP